MIKGNGTTYLWLGALAFLGGILALANPVEASVAVVQIVGAVLIVLGIMKILVTLRRRGDLSWFDLVLGLLELVLGISLLTDVGGGLISLTVVAAILLMLEGALLAYVGSKIRPAGPWIWIFLSGVISIFLAVYILGNLDALASQVLGILLGIDLISNGIWMGAMGMLLRRM